MDIGKDLKRAYDDGYEQGKQDAVRWIPMTERLPNENGEYLVYGNDKVCVCEFMIFGSVIGWCNRAMNPCVKYWMPLPEPPKEE